MRSRFPSPLKYATVSISVSASAHPPDIVKTHQSCINSQDANTIARLINLNIVMLVRVFHQRQLYPNDNKPRKSLMHTV